MDFIFFKLKLKVAWFKLTRRLSHSNEIVDFKISQIDNSAVLIVFPFNKNQFKSEIKYIYEIIDTLVERNVSITIIINSIYKDSIKLYDIDIHIIETNNKGSMKNISSILNQIYLKNFNFVIDLNSPFNIDLAMLINELKSNYKIGFKSDFSDLFYNIQLKRNQKKNGYTIIKDMLS